MSGIIRRRKISNPRRILPRPQVPPANSLHVSVVPIPMAPASDIEEPQAPATPAAQLELIIGNLCRLCADLTSIEIEEAASNANSKIALEHLAEAEKRLMEGLDYLKIICNNQPKPSDSVSAIAPSSGNLLDLTNPASSVVTPAVRRRRPFSTQDWQDKVDPTFVPSVSLDGQSVILSDKHPAVTMPVESHRRLLMAARGVATLHLRALLKHFISRDVLAESSVNGSGAYKRILNREIVAGICDYIGKRYPGALTKSRMQLCCTDVCVQARRRRKASHAKGGASGSVGGGGGGSSTVGSVDDCDASC